MTATRWRARAAMSIVFLANGLAFGTFAANLPRIKALHGLPDSSLGLMLLAASTGAVAGMPFAGWLASRLGSGRVAVGAGWLIAITLPLPALVPGGLALTASAFAFGVCMGTMDVSMNARGAQLEEGWGAPIMSSLHAAWSAGGLLGSVIAAGLASVGASPALGLAGPALLVVAASSTGRILPPAAAVAAGTNFAFPDRAMLALCALAALCFSAEGAVSDWAAVYQRDWLHVSESRAALAYSAFALAMATGRALGDEIVRRLGPWIVVGAGGAMAAFGLAVGLFAPWPLLSSVGLVVTGLGLANVVPVVFSAAGRARGPIGVAMVATIGYGGLMAAPPLIGAVSDAAGLRQALLLPLAGMLAIVALSRLFSPSGGRT